MAAKTFLVTAATGNVGTPVVEKLLARGYKVHALTSSPESARARSLEKAGARVFGVEWRDEAGLAAAMQGCFGVFLNPHPPKAEDFQYEPLYAKKVLEAARAASVQVVVLNSVSGTPDITGWPEWEDFLEHVPGFKAYWLNKQATLQSVRDAGLPQWASIGGSQYYSNFASPKNISFMQPRLREQPVGKLSGTTLPTTQIHLIDPIDVAEFCVLALTDPARFRGRHIDIYGERLTVPQIAASMSRILGKEIRVADDDIEFMPHAGRLNDISATRMKYGDLTSYGVKFGSYDDWLNANKDEIRAALG